MTTRRRIADRSSTGDRYGHLLPVLHAEQSWGNSTRDGFESAAKDGVWSLRLREPLRLDRLQAEFEFPPHIKLGRDGEGRTFLWDEKNYVEISAPPPQPPRRPRTGLLAWILGG